MDKLDALRVYCQIINSGGFNKAAQVLGVSPAFVSQCLARLESVYGTRLVERSTRRRSFTNRPCACWKITAPSRRKCAAPPDDLRGHCG